jgi:hypothetical protein
MVKGGQAACERRTSALLSSADDCSGEIFTSALGHKQTIPMWLGRDRQQRLCGLGQWSTLNATRQITAFDPVPPVGFGAIERAIGFRQQKIPIAGVSVRRLIAAD